jgi:hypothetical protein
LDWSGLEIFQITVAVLSGDDDLRKKAAPSLCGNQHAKSCYPLADDCGVAINSQSARATFAVREA